MIYRIDYSKLQFHVQFKFEEQLNCMRGHSEINKIEFDPIFGVNIYTRAAVQVKAFNWIDLSAVIIKLQQLNDYTMLLLPLAASIVSYTKT